MAINMHHLVFFTCINIFILLLPRAQPHASGTHVASSAPRFVYFDLGANNGDSITAFLDAHPPTAYWDVVLIEANPLFTAQLRALCANAVVSGRARSCLPLVETALTTYDGRVDIFLDEVRAEHDASSIIKTANLATAGNKGRVFSAAALDVETLFTSTFAVHKTDFVAVKMDIEGAEFPVLSRAIIQGLLPLWDELSVEWHDANPYIFGGTALQAIYFQKRQCLLTMLEEANIKVGAWT